MTTLLVGDIGGTKTLLSLYRSQGDELEPVAEERFVSADWERLDPMVAAFLGRNGAVGGNRPGAACFAVAGPVRGGRARLTNLPWQLEEADLARACGIARVELVNDFAVLVYGLPHLRVDQQAPIHAGEADPLSPRLILGAGTGLGVAMGIAVGGGLQAVASEAAHGEFAPRNEREWKLKQWLRQEMDLERVSIERVVSGTGLGWVARWLLAMRHPSADHPLCRLAADADLPAAVAAAAASGDGLAAEALEIWLGAYGSVTGDLALGCLSLGGIWLAGGTAAKLLAGLRSPAFREALLNKGRLRTVLNRIPVTAVIDPAVGTFSAACRGRALLA